MDFEFVDADAHVVEVEFAPECLKRWPNEFTFDPENKQLRTEGRRYLEFQGPGAGCPPEHGLSTAEGINPFSPEGTLADADKDGIDEMVFFPSFGLRARLSRWDGNWPESPKPLRERKDIPDDVRAKIAGANARRFYRL